jgi:transposase
MNRDHFWLTDMQFAKIAPHLPTDTRGKARVDDRRVLSGIVHVLKSGGRWIDAPPEYGPKKTPETHCLVRDIDSTLVQQILDVAQRERIPHVHHHGEADDFRRCFEVPKQGQGAHPPPYLARRAGQRILI